MIAHKVERSESDAERLFGRTQGATRDCLKLHQISKRNVFNILKICAFIIGMSTFYPAHVEAHVPFRSALPSQMIEDTSLAQSLEMGHSQGNALEAERSIPDDVNVLDSDQDGLNDDVDEDDDNDGWADTSDDFPLNPVEWQDTDLDGIGDNGDADDDNDGVFDTDDPCPLTSYKAERSTEDSEQLADICFVDPEQEPRWQAVGGGVSCSAGGLSVSANSTRTSMALVLLCLIGIGRRRGRRTAD